MIFNKFPHYGMFEEPRVKLENTLVEAFGFNRAYVNGVLLGPVIKNLIKQSYAYQNQYTKENPHATPEQVMKTLMDFGYTTILPYLAKKLEKAPSEIKPYVETYIGECKEIFKRNEPKIIQLNNIKAAAQQQSLQNASSSLSDTKVVNAGLSAVNRAVEKSDEALPTELSKHMEYLIVVKGYAEHLNTKLTTIFSGKTPDNSSLAGKPEHTMKH